MSRALSPATRARLTAALLVALLASVVAIGFRPHFETHDDVFLIRSLSGSPFATPDPYAPTLSFSAGLLLSTLYRLAPGVPWYAGALYLTLGFALVLLVAPLVRGRSDGGERGLAPVAQLVALTPALIYGIALPSYTAAALFTYGAAVVSWRDRNDRATLVLAMVALALALFWRWRLIGLLLVPLPLFCGVHRLDKRFGLLLLAAVAFLGVDRLAFSLVAPREAKQFAAYNFVRARFHDSGEGEPRGERTRKALHAAGWSETQYEAFRRWWLFDPLFETQRIERFLAANQPTLTERTREAAGRAWFNLRHAPEPFLLLLLLLALRLALPAGAAGGGPALRAAGDPVLRAAGDPVLRAAESPALRAAEGPAWARWIWIAPALALLGYVLSFRFIDRIALPLLALFLVLLRQGDAPRRLPAPPDRGSRWRLYGAASALLFLATTSWLLVWPFLRGLESTTRLETQLHDAFQRARRSLPVDVVLIPMEHTVERLAGASPFANIAELRGLRVLPCAAQIHSPYYRRVLRALGAKDGPTLLRLAVDNPRYLFVTQRGDARKRFVERYLAGLWSAPRRVELQPVLALPLAGNRRLSFYRARFR